MWDYNSRNFDPEPRIHKENNEPCALTLQEIRLKSQNSVAKSLSPYTSARNSQFCKVLGLDKRTPLASCPLRAVVGIARRGCTRQCPGSPIVTGRDQDPQNRAYALVQ